MIYVAYVTLSFNESLLFQWTFSGLNINISQCRLDSISIVVEQCQSNTKYLIEEPKIIIYNSSFGNLDLEPGTRAQITDCHIDAEFKDKGFTLITATNSDISIQNCHFENFISENDSTILFGYNNMHVTIENSVFIQHKSSEGVLFLQGNSFMRISSSVISQNVAFTLGYSAITLVEEVNAFMKNTLFSNNSAINGGVMYLQDHCQVTVANCTFSSNKAITGKTLNVSKNSKL